VGSAHLNPVFHVVTRTREARFLKERLIEFNVAKLPVVFGGDFNTLLLGEKMWHNHIFAPEFVNATTQSGPTVDSAYIEPVIFSTKCTACLATLGIHFRTKVDHIYFDSDTAKATLVSCKVLGERVSDHSPVEVVIRDKAKS
jgi:endonuclease/exonuclease/phosphatase family metal-dependent hydrolase